MPPSPRELQLEVTGACNLRCRMCLVSYRPGLSRREGSMPYETFRRLVDAVPGLERLTLQGLGEPLLAPDLVRMVAHASGRGVRVGFNTNGMLLTPARARELADAGLDWLHVSIDGATAEVHEGIRAGADLERVVEHVRAAARIADEHGGRPRMSLVTVAMRRNVHQLPDLVRLAADVGVPRLWVQNLSHSFSDAGGSPDFAAISRFTAGEALWAGDGPAEPALAAARAAADELGVELRLPRAEEAPRPRPAGTPGCDWPWRSAYVTHRGRVQPCCMVMGEDRATLGDLAEASFADIWEGEAYAAFRDALRTDEPPAVCRGCSLYRGVF